MEIEKGRFCTKIAKRFCYETPPGTCMKYPVFFQTVILRCRWICGLSVEARRRSVAHAVRGSQSGRFQARGQGEAAWLASMATQTQRHQQPATNLIPSLPSASGKIRTFVKQTVFPQAASFHISCSTRTIFVFRRVESREYLAGKIQNSTHAGPIFSKGRHPPSHEPWHITGGSLLETATLNCITFSVDAPQSSLPGSSHNNRTPQRLEEARSKPAKKDGAHVTPPSHDQNGNRMLASST